MDETAPPTPVKDDLYYLESIIFLLSCLVIVLKVIHKSQCAIRSHDFGHNGYKCVARETTRKYIF